MAYDLNHAANKSRDTHVTRIAWIVPKLTAGGIGPVCRYAAEGVAQIPGWRCTIVALNDPVGNRTDDVTAVRYASLGLEASAPREFLQWLASNPQEMVISNDVSRVEPAFPYFPRGTLHVIQIHDSMRRYRSVALRNHGCIDGVVCVARHIEASLRSSMEALGFHGVLGTVHNGAHFPPAPARSAHAGPLRLLFIGNMDALIKGVLDLVSILARLRVLAVPVRLIIVGGRHEWLERRLKRRKLDHLVAWTGRIPHHECYRLASENDIFLMTSRHEAFGMVTIETMAMGCVPLAYDIVSGTREIIQHGRSGLLLPLGHFDAIAQAIKSMHENRTRWAELSAGAMHRARTEFSATTLAGRLSDFLSRVIANARLSPAARQDGFPPERQGGIKPYWNPYQRLPAGFRSWLRNLAGNSPRLCYWLARRWNQ